MDPQILDVCWVSMKGKEFLFQKDKSKIQGTFSLIMECLTWGYLPYCLALLHPFKILRLSCVH